MQSWHEVLAQHGQDEQIAVCGDWHGDFIWAEKKIEQAAELGIGMLFHGGDFGVWPGPKGKKFLLRVSRACIKHNVKIAVTLGNHENWDRLNARWENPKNRDVFGNLLPLQLEPNVFILPRPYRFKLAGVRFLSLGGAASVDFDRRREGKTWWRAEMIEEDHVQLAIAGGRADIMLTHETPDSPYAVPQVQHILATNPMGFSLQGLGYSALSRARLTRAFEAVMPKVLLHGHMHTSGQHSFQFKDAGHPTSVISLSEEMTNTNFARVELAPYREA